MKRIKIFAVLIVGLVVAFAVGCDGSGGANGGGGACPQTNVSIAVCDPDAGQFSLNINNPFFPVVVDSQSMLEGVDDEGATILLIITVLDETEVVADVTTRVLEEMELVDDELIEVPRNFFAQAPDGTVCYFGEEVDIFEDGVIVSHEGAWRADEPGNQPGIIMLANPVVGDIYSQEDAPEVAEDQAEVQALGETIVVPAGTFNDTLRTEDCNRLDGTTDTKVFVRDIGLAIDQDVQLLP